MTPRMCEELACSTSTTTTPTRLQNPRGPHALPYSHRGVHSKRSSCINVIHHSQVECRTATGEHTSSQLRCGDGMFVQIPERIVQVRFPSLASIAFEHAGALPP